MRKTLTAIAAAATIGIAAVATPTTADARWGWWGPALGGLAVGAIVGSALASPYYYGGYYGGYYPAYSYYPSYGYGYPAYSYGGYAPAYYGYAYSPRPYYSCWRWRAGYLYHLCCAVAAPIWDRHADAADCSSITPLFSSPTPLSP